MSETATPTGRVRTAPRGRDGLALPAALMAPSAYPGEPEVELRETHASWVFLAGEHAYKVKKPVRLAFLDYSTLARRRAACSEEVLVNSELAPDVYERVVAIVRAGGGVRFAEDDSEQAIEYAVVMRRFAEAGTLQSAVEQCSLTDAHVRAVAERLARFHRDAARAGGGTPGRVLEIWRENVAELAAIEHPARWDLEGMRAFGEAFVLGAGRELERRRREGHIRDGHGDLRCEHVLLGPPVRVVDRIEFDPALRRMDVACDLAFLVMDLRSQRRERAARELVAAYRRAGGDPGSERLRAFYTAYWALVRAKVALIAADERRGREAGRQRRRAARLWTLAERSCWRARRPLAIVVCGAPASGKSTLAAELKRRSGLPVVSSDAVRKRLAGLPATARARPEHYTREFTRATYDQLGRDALEELERREGVIVDATCQDRAQRALLLRRLRAASAALLVVRCQVSLATALARAGARMRSAGRVSDASPEIVRERFGRFDALEELPAGVVLELDTGRDVDQQVQQVTRALDRRGDRRASARGGDGAGARRAAAARARAPQ